MVLKIEGQKRHNFFGQLFWANMGILVYTACLNLNTFRKKQTVDRFVSCNVLLLLTTTKLVHVRNGLKPHDCVLHLAPEGEH